MSEVNGGRSERGRNIESLLFHAASRAGYTHIAAELRISDPTMSRLMSEHLSKFADMVAFLGLKLVPVSSKCFKPGEVEALQMFAKRGIDYLEEDPE